MSDYQDFCESNGGCASDPEFMDNWLDYNCSESPSTKPHNKMTKEEKERVTGFDYSLLARYKLSSQEVHQIKKYLAIYIDHNFSEQKFANSYITKKKLWHEFPDIRSLNEHGEHKNVPGILPRIYSISNVILDVTKGDGQPLTGYNKY
jgi:hypothetical protein